MVDGQNLAYALTQVVHNFGAAFVVGGAVFARWPAWQPRGAQRRLAWLVLLGWAAQAASGAGFGAISYAYYGQFPDIHGIAIAALATKMACAVAGFLLAALYLRREARWPERNRSAAWAGSAVLAAIALTAAAFLRWFS
jgi:hypothetical protein